MMPRVFATTLILLGALGAMFSSSSLHAVPPSEQILPDTTMGYVSIADVDDIRKRWGETQFGKLFDDPLMKPFADDLQEQLKERLSQTGVRIGITWSDLDGVYGGEICGAAIEPRGNGTHAVVMMVDVTGHLDAARALLAKVEKNQTAGGAKKSSDKIGSTDRTILTFTPTERGELPWKAFYFIKDDLLVATDDDQTSSDILAKLAGSDQKTLADNEAFTGINARIDEISQDLSPNLHWFIRPLGYARVIRASLGTRHRGADHIKQLGNQGFDAIKGIGGHVNLATGGYEVLHRSMIWAPKAADAEEGDRYRLGMRMLDFPATNTLTAEPWIPADISSYVTFNWKMKEAFGYAESIFNEMIGGGDEEMFDAIWRDMKRNTNLDFPEDFIVHLGERVTVMTDHTTPITPNCERLLVSIEITNAPAVKTFIQKWMEFDRNKKKVVAGHDVWFLPEQEYEGVDEINIDFNSFDDDFDNEFDNEDDPIEEEDVAAGVDLMANAAVTIANGRLFVGSNIDIIRKVLDPKPDATPLAQLAAYKRVNTQLIKLGAGDDSLRIFSLTDEAYRPTYELIKDGKMPEAETLLGRMLNALFPVKKGETRKQQIDGTKLPEFEAVRKYFGPAGAHASPDDDGWITTGAIIKSEPVKVPVKKPAEVVE